MYPHLKAKVRFKGFSKLCWLYAPQYGKDCAVPQYVAYILTLMDGSRTINDIKQAVSVAFKSDEQKSNKLVDNIVADYSSCIDWHQEVQSVALYNNPQDFLVNGFLKDEQGADTECKRLDTPNELVMPITGVCNFKCVYCFSESAKHMPGELSGTEWCNIVEQAKHLGVFQVFVTGGEPTLHPDLALILHCIKMSDMDFTLLTNGSCLTDELCELLSGENVQVSLNAPNRDTHKYLSGTDTFETIIRNIERLVTNGTRVSVKSMITSLGTENLQGLYLLCDNLGVESLSLSEFDVSSSGHSWLDLHVPDKKKDEVRLKCSSIEMLHTKLKLNLDNDVWHTAAGSVGCRAFRSTMIISANGEFIGCEKMLDVPGMSIGNIRDHTLRELWQSPKVDEFTQNICNSDDIKCRSCSGTVKCRTGCFAIKHYFDTHNAQSRIIQ